MKYLITLSICLIAYSTFACSCGHVGIIKNKNEVDYVFTGRLEEIKETVTEEKESRTKNTIEYRVTQYTFKVNQNFKGLEDQDKIELLMSRMTDCPVAFDLNKTYIVYAYRDDKKLDYRLADQKADPYITTHLCTRTKRKSFFSFWETFILWLT